MKEVPLESREDIYKKIFFDEADFLESLPEDLMGMVDEWGLEAVIDFMGEDSSISPDEMDTWQQSEI